MGAAWLTDGMAQGLVVGLLSSQSSEQRSHMANDFDASSQTSPDETEDIAVGEEDSPGFMGPRWGRPDLFKGVSTTCFYSPQMRLRQVPAHCRLRQSESVHSDVKFSNAYSFSGYAGALLWSLIACSRHVPIHCWIEKFLEIQVDKHVLQFTVLPFSISIAPRVFTKLREVVASTLCHQGVKVLIPVCLDECLV